MRCVPIAIIYTVAFLCCLPACSSDTTCTIKTGKSVYAFPKNIMNMRNQTSKNSSNAFEFMLAITRHQSSKKCSKRNQFSFPLEPNNTLRTATIGSWSYKLRYSLGQFKENHINLKKSSKTFYDLNSTYHQFNFTVNAETIFENFTDSKGPLFGEAKFFFLPSLDSCNVQRCSVIVRVVKDKAPTARFKTSISESPRKLFDETLDLNQTYSFSKVVKLDIKNNNSEIQVSIDVADSDYFVNNSDKFDYCIVNEPNVTLSAVITFYIFSQNGSRRTPQEQQLALVNDFNKSQNAWWTKNSSRINETLWNVRFDFAVSALISAINGLLSTIEKSANFSLVRSLDASVNITLHVTATSGRTNPQKTTATFVLVQNIKRELLTATTNEGNEDKVQKSSSPLVNLLRPTDNVTAANKNNRIELPSALASSSTLTYKVPSSTAEIEGLLPTLKPSSQLTYNVTTANEKISDILLTLLVIMCCGTVAVILLLIKLYGYYSKTMLSLRNMQERKDTTVLACVLPPVASFQNPNGKTKYRLLFTGELP